MCERELTSPSLSFFCSRFLRARKFDVEAAVKQYCEFLEWRERKHVDSDYENFDVEAFEDLRRLYPMWTGRRDLVSS